RPTLIVADEPVASLNPSTSTGVLDLLRGIAHSEGVAVVCSLHQVHLARAYADRIVGLSSGRVVFDLPTARFDESAFQRLYHSHGADNVTGPAPSLKGLAGTPPTPVRFRGESVHLVSDRVCPVMT